MGIGKTIMISGVAVVLGTMCYASWLDDPIGGMAVSGISLVIIGAIVAGQREEL